MQGCGEKRVINFNLGKENSGSSTVNWREPKVSQGIFINLKLYISMPATCSLKMGGGLLEMIEPTMRASRSSM